MKELSSKRLFLKKSAMASTGLVLFSPSIFSAINSNESPIDGYNPYIKEKSDIRRSSLFDKHLYLKGKTFNKSGSTTLANTTVNIWHLSPNSNKFGHQGKVTTDKFGSYHFKTDFPHRERGKYPRVYFKVSNGETSYFTEVSLK